MGNERLRSAMAKAHVSVESISNETGVDPKTVQRWLGGRVPYARHRWAISKLLNEEEAYPMLGTVGPSRSCSMRKRPTSGRRR